MHSISEMTAAPKYRHLVESPRPSSEVVRGLQNIHSRAFARFQELGFPTRKSEDWKYINLEPILETAFLRTPADALPPHVDQGAIAKYLLKDSNTTRIAIINETISKHLSNLSSLPAGVCISDIASALVQHRELIEMKLTSSLEHEANAFALLNAAHFRDGIFLHIPEETAFTEPLELLFITANTENQPTVFYPRLFINLEARAHVDLIITQVDFSTLRSFNNIVADIFVGEGATLNTTLLQRNSAQALQFLTTKIHQAATSNVQMTTFTSGGALTRNETIAHLAGVDASCSLSGLCLLTGTSQVYSHVQTQHLVPRCQSRQLYKNILNGEARSEFNSLSHIHHGAVHSDSEQLNRNMVLSTGARALARPQLKVFNEDVKAAHGATVGQVSEAELFYLRSRGIPKTEARALLVYGFAEEVVDLTASKSIKDHLETFVHHDVDEVVAHAS